MKFFYKILKIIPVVIIVLLINTNPGCKDPYDYEPPFDSLIPPPDATPQLLYPGNDTTLWYDQWRPYPNDIELGWTSVEGTQYYQLQMGNNTIEVYDTSYTFTIIHDGYYYWRVRAYSRNWEYYTDWSDTWLFMSWYRPGSYGL